MLLNKHTRSAYRAQEATLVTLCLERLGRRQVSFIGPPEPMLFYKLPGLFHLALHDVIPAPPAQRRNGQGNALKFINP